MNPLIHRDAPLRVLVLVILLGASLVLLGCAGAYFVRGSNRAYTGITQREFPLLSIVRQITREATVTRRMVTQAFNERATTSFAKDVELFQEAVDRNNVNMTELQRLLDNEGVEVFQKLGKSREHYVTRARSALALLPALSAEKVQAERRALDDLFSVYFEDQDDMAVFAEGQAIRKSEKAIKAGERLYAFFVIMALWPFAVAIVFSAYVFLTTTYVFVRRRP